MNVHYSSKTYDWSTPQDFFERYDRIYNFKLDVCASVFNAKCEKFFTVEDDGLEQNWTGQCWMNPPYGRSIGKWMQKAYESCVKNNATVVCLVPSRTDTKWWHDYAMKGDIEFIKGRLRFGGAKENAPFPSAVITFKPETIRL
mgnify:FL=1